MVNREALKSILPTAQRTAESQSQKDSSGKSTDAAFPVQASPHTFPTPDSETAEIELDEAFVSVPEVFDPLAVAQALESKRLEALVPSGPQFDQSTELPPRQRRIWLFAVPSWLVSLLIHVALLVILAAIHMEPVKKVFSVLIATSGQESALALQEFDVSAMDISAPKSDEPLAMPTPIENQVIPVVDVNNMQMREMSSLNVEPPVSSIVEQVVPSSVLASTAITHLTTALNSRSPSIKGQMLERFGGTVASEKSVAMGLKWISEHQAPNGGWNFAHALICRGQCKDQGTMATAKNAATAMALMPFLGAGQTHLEGQYKETVKRGLSFLISSMEVTSGPSPHGSWHEDFGNMYSHGLAAITICEAYAMTHDPDLLQPAQLAINFIVYAQDPRGGGWRYIPKEPGDTSVVGWQLMALKSGAMGNLQVPPETFRLASSFLDSVSVNKGAYYGYNRATSKIEGRFATTAVGLLCRMYLGTPKNDPGLVEGVKFLSKRGPDLADLYYSYYATQVLRHHGGPEWEKWNNSMRDALVKAQVKEGHASGSWLTHVQGRGGHADKGGRLYCTSLATMMLEVYYRHMPLYSEKSSTNDFQL